VLGTGTRVGPGARIEGCVIGEGVEIGAGVRLDGLVVVGDRAQIGAGVAITGPASVDVGEVRTAAAADPAGGSST
jgi:UDP-3-O-[3-hydroxymyristoyl] glucosamine N-acyltransferase